MILKLYFVPSLLLKKLPLKSVGTAITKHLLGKLRLSVSVKLEEPTPVHHVPENQKLNGGTDMKTIISPRISPTERGTLELYWFSKDGEEGNFRLTPKMARIMAEQLLSLSREVENDITVGSKS